MFHWTENTGSGGKIKGLFNIHDRRIREQEQRNRIAINYSKGGVGRLLVGWGGPGMVYLPIRIPTLFVTPIIFAE